MTTLPLSGIRVLDLTQVYAGPTCTRILSDLGADVIKLEGLKRMDITRNFVMPENAGKDDYWNRAGYFLLRNGGKRSVTLDFSDPAAVELVKRLVPHADIVAESFTPRVMAKFGLDYESLKQIKPEIIMISLSGYGQTGPWRDFTAYGMGLGRNAPVFSFEAGHLLQGQGVDARSYGVVKIYAVCLHKGLHPYMPL